MAAGDPRQRVAGLGAARAEATGRAAPSQALPGRRGPWSNGGNGSCPGRPPELVTGESALGSWGSSKERDSRLLAASQWGKDY